MQSLAGSRTICLSLLVSALVAGIPARFGGVASAGTIDIWSLPSNGSNNITVANVSVTPSPAWYMPAAGSGFEWISYTDSGCNEFNPITGRCTPGPGNPPATTVTGTPTAIFYQTFTLTAAASGDLDVWADDTAGVWLDTGTVTSGDGSGGTLLEAPNGNLGPNCANGPIGCLPGNGGAIPLSLSAGTYTLVFDVYQLVSSTPFGLMYDGVLSTPEPASYMLMGLGLAALGVFARRRKR
jgi:hypothetical protein